MYIIVCLMISRKGMFLIFMMLCNNLLGQERVYVKTDTINLDNVLGIEQCQLFSNINVDSIIVSKCEIVHSEAIILLAKSDCENYFYVYDYYVRDSSGLSCLDQRIEEACIRRSLIGVKFYPKFFSIKGELKEEDFFLLKLKKVYD